MESEAIAGWTVRTAIVTVRRSKGGLAGGRYITLAIDSVAWHGMAHPHRGISGKQAGARSAVVR